MIEVQKSNRIRGFMRRLKDDTAGNVIALMAAAVVPTIGLVGGGLDMSRIYLVKTRLQAACDAGSLMGRRVMGANTWNANSFKARTEAERIFNMNFEDGAYGTEPVTKSYTETGGNVSGTATTTVPMTLMRVLGSEEREITVTCSSEMRIPDSDVMFVLDTTGSMAWTASGSSSVSPTNPARIDGLKVATQCFYETLTQQNIPEVSPAACGNTSDPTLTDSNSSVIRFGFVPYASNVNVGKLLPLDYIADNWDYQTRKANHSLVTIFSFIYGTESAKVQSNQSPGNSPGNWQYSSDNLVQGSKTFLKTVSGGKGLNCTKITLPVDATNSSTNGPNQIAPFPGDPVNPQSSVRKYYQTIGTTSTTQWRYVPETGNVSQNKKCYLQYRTASNSLTTNYYTDTPVTWSSVQKKVFNNWTYDKISVNVSGLKDETNNAWNSSLNLPLRGDDDSGTSAVDERGTDISIPWDGCILERETVREPSSWYPIPADAKDMDIDLEPDANDPTTQWGPRLPNILWARNILNGDGSNSSNLTLNPVTTAKSDMLTPWGDRSCPTQAKIYQTWSPGAFRSYVNSLAVNGNTFHDIGLLWGARLMSPSGIFKSNNGEGNDLIQRHMIFMTDGDTNANSDSLSAYNFPYYDRLQTDTGSAPSTSELNTITDERTSALCTAIKNKNITLWVVSYGASVSSTANAKLQDCASTGRFYQATTTAALTTQFKAIAAQISALRLTN
jgi:Flp pilus assembly protein TadG